MAVIPVVDGLFHHVIEHEGRLWPHYGRFITLDRGRTIEHTWASEATKGLESVVHITRETWDGKTCVILRHTSILDDEAGRGHEAGWTWLLSTLAQRFEGGSRGDDRRYIARQSRGCSRHGQIFWRARNTRTEIDGIRMIPHTLLIEVLCGESRISSVMTVTIAFSRDSLRASPTT